MITLGVAVIKFSPSFPYFTAQKKMSLHVAKKNQDSRLQHHRPFFGIPAARRFPPQRPTADAPSLSTPISPISTTSSPPNDAPSMQILAGNIDSPADPTVTVARGRHWRVRLYHQRRGSIAPALKQLHRHNDDGSIICTTISITSEIRPP